MLVKYKLGGETLVLETTHSYYNTEDSLCTALGLEYTPTKVFFIKDSNLTIDENDLEPIVLDDLRNIKKKGNKYYLIESKIS